MANQWFRLYAEFAHDPKVQMLSEVDQRRYIMLLCMRCNGDVTLQKRPSNAVDTDTDTDTDTDISTDVDIKEKRAPLFDAQAQANAVALEWVTANESNSSRFIVERSSDGEAWSELLTMPAAGTSNSPRVYKMEDRAPIVGNAYYRLRMLDLDGSEVLSQVRSVRFNPSARVAPNPATGPFAVTGVGADQRVQLFDRVVARLEVLRVPLEWTPHRMTRVQRVQHDVLRLADLMLKDRREH